MPHVVNARRKALRAVLSALAGGGLTAAGIGSPAALAAGTPEGTGTTTASETATTPQGSTETTPTQTSTSTSTETTPAPAPSSTVPTTTTPAPAPAAEVPTVVLQRRQKTTPSVVKKKTTSTTSAKTKKSTETTGENNVASSPQAIASAGALAAILASSQSSVEALSFYRIPLFLLPIYKAAAVQYGVPWQILAAINEIETDYGTDQSVSSAGAVGWMQFMPSTWLQYGVDALNAGDADPYNPVDAVFAAARYLRAAGAATNLRRAILAYNHSEEYVDSVLLRAQLISTYPKVVIATLTGLIDGRLPVSGSKVSWVLPEAAALSASTATAGAAVAPQAAAGSSSAQGTTAVSPTAAASKAQTAAKPSPTLFAQVESTPDASVLAVQDGRVARIGTSANLGHYLILRDVYGDLFTYAGLGSLAHSYLPSKPTEAPQSSPVVQAASTHDPKPSQAASAGVQLPVTLSVKTPKPQVKTTAAAGQAALPSTDEAPPAGMGRVRLFSHPGNPDAKAAAAAQAARVTATKKAEQRQPLQAGSVVPAGTVLGKVSTTPGAASGSIRFAVRPAGDPGTIDPAPILANWAQLQTALHPKGARATDPLLGATASDVFLLSKSELQRAVLSDPGITLGACERREVASGAADTRVLAVLAFLSRSGLQPTVKAIGCATGHSALAGQQDGDFVDISAIDGKPVTGHQGPGTISDLTIRALLTLPAKFVPSSIISLMRYPGQPATLARSAFWNRIRVTFAPAPAAHSKLSAAAVSTAAHSAGKGAAAPSPVVSTSVLSAAEWNQLMVRIGSISVPLISTKPSSAAIADPKRP
jgi:membrane-bound lytic murein transglycosylase B